MPSSFIRKHVRGLLRSKFATTIDPNGDQPSEDSDEPSTPKGDENTDILSAFYLGGVDLKKHEFPEVYFGKTGLDLPCIQLESLNPDVFASYTGPDGGLTQVGEVRAHQMVQMANIDDEMSLSIGGTTDGEADSDDEDDDEDDLHTPISINAKASSKTSLLLGSCSSLMGPNGYSIGSRKPSADDYDWTVHDTKAAFGVSVSLYERNPLTGVNAGEPVADVWGVVGRSNNGVLALADGVNWGEGARLAARCAIRGAIDHMNEQIVGNSLESSTQVFHEMLAAFHSAHSLILQEGGMLTTLCLAFVAPMRCGSGWVLCVCNVGDSLCFVYNRNYGVREVTLGSHDIDQMRDMRDAGGALGPVDGRNPQLHNLTCSMTFVEAGDVVFITSDGVSDNFDPVVGKFCVIKKSDQENKENGHLPQRQNRGLDIATNDTKNKEYAKNRTCAASLPCVDAAKRHELMLVRMRDIIANGTTPQTRTPDLSLRTAYPAVSASLLCQRLIQFATQLSQAKRRVLENPELYKKEKMTKSEQKERRKMVREKIAEMPGKLDHASVVAYHVSRAYERDLGSPLRLTEDNVETARVSDESCVNLDVNFENYCGINKASCATIIVKEEKATASANIKASPTSPVKVGTPRKLNSDDQMLLQLVEKVNNNNNNNKLNMTDKAIGKTISPYEQIPVTARELKKKKHARGSAQRHTVGVDIQLIKRFFTKKNEDKNSTEEIRGDMSLNPSNTDRTTFRKRIKGMFGSNKNIALTAKE